MGKFIVSRSAAGDRFVLQSDHGQTLAVSRHYATLDACKKGIASLIVNAPVMPVCDATVGEYGPNPKFEIVAGKGGFAFLVKSANGKSVITSPAYATKKACLRAIAMLRRGVCDYEILFHSKEGFTPLTMKAPVGATAKPLREAHSAAPIIAPEPKVLLEEIDPPAQGYAPLPQSCTQTEIGEATEKPHTVAKDNVTKTASQISQASSPMPRVIRLQSAKREVPGPRPAAAKKPPQGDSVARRGRYGIFSKLFKNK